MARHASRITMGHIGYDRELIQSDARHREYVSALTELERRSRLTADERKYANLLAVLIEKFEKERYPVRKSSPLEVLRFLIEENNLRQKDLAPLLGSESIVSEVLSGKRELTKRHIEKLSRRFKVSPGLFFEQ